MQKFKVLFTAERVYFAENMDKAEEIAQKDIQYMSNFKAQIFSISPFNSVGIYPTDMEEE
tara:strand:+ start:1241 stop:1420 length:180 start_codon:yes stop_codon:yes gene_type:complete